MPRLIIDGQETEVPTGATVLAAAQGLGIEIPTLCFAEGVRPRTSCMICVVEDKTSGRVLPSCSAPAQDGMVIETHNAALTAARREVLQLLLSEHAADCEAPCRRMCPASMDIPLMLRHIQQGHMDAAARVAKRDLALPATLGYVCTAPCEKGCRRGVIDEAASIRGLHRQAAEEALAAGAAGFPCGPDTGKRVAVIGGGAAGLAAAWTLRLQGHACTVYEKRAQAGGALRALTPGTLPEAILDAEIETIRQAGVQFAFDQEVAEAGLRELGADAVIVACEGLPVAAAHVFLAKEDSMPVRSVSNGKGAAEAADRYLQGIVESPEKRFDSRLGRLSREEAVDFAQGRLDEEARCASGRCEDISKEAGRCLHCDCSAAVSCKLRQYATQYGAKHNAYRDAEPPPLDPVRRDRHVMFEPAKCIKCGLCIEIARAEGEHLGLAFVGRGFNVRLRTPFNATLDEALSKTARRCIAACPTGALSNPLEEPSAP